MFKKAQYKHQQFLNTIGKIENHHTNQNVRIL